MKGDKELVGTLQGFDDYVSILHTYSIPFHFIFLNIIRHGIRRRNRIVSSSFIH
jgi:hypothetical protein